MIYTEVAKLATKLKILPKFPAIILCTCCISLAVIEVANVTAGITATAVFFCNVTGAGGADNIGYFWTQSLNGMIPENRFPFVIYEDRVIGLRTSMLSIINLSGLEQDFDYTCTVSINSMEIGSATGTLTSPGVYMYSGLPACFAG